MYDLIGDIHGQADTLRRLLERLGYTRTGDAFAHPERTAVFVGDLVDRGPDTPGTVRLVRSMVDSGAARAVMGNHEYNLLAWHTTHPETGEPLRPHSARNLRQIQRTLEQYERAGGLASDLEWMRTLPPVLDLGTCRVVHATWDPDLIDVLESLRDADGRLDDDALARSSALYTRDWDAIEVVLKGREARVPDGVEVEDADGRPRRRIRVRWYDDPDGATWASYGMQPGVRLPQSPIPPAAHADAVPYPPGDVPVFFGHYGLDDARPRVLRANVACLDYGAGRGWNLCAYRFDGEPRLEDERFVWESADPVPGKPPKVVA